jgi:hypothetical protein
MIGGEVRHDTVQYFTVRIRRGTDTILIQYRTVQYNTTVQLLISIPVLRVNTETMCNMCVSSYSKVGAIEQRYMVNSGVRGTKNNHLGIEMNCTSIAPNIYPIII